MSTKESNYEALISCYGGAIARFEFYAESAQLAEDHILHILNSDDPIGFEWSSIPSQFHYIHYKKKNNKNNIYQYTAKPYDHERHKQWEVFSKKVPAKISDMLSIIERLSNTAHAEPEYIYALISESQKLLNELNK